MRNCVANLAFLSISCRKFDPRCGISVAGALRRSPPPSVDTQAAPYGHGCHRKGDGKITFGTGAFALALIGDSSNASTIFEPRRKASTVIEWYERFTEAVSR